MEATDTIQTELKKEQITQCSVCDQPSPLADTALLRREDHTLEKGWAPEKDVCQDCACSWYECTGCLHPTHTEDLHVAENGESICHVCT